MSTLITLGDQPLAKVLPALTLLEKINLRGCTKVGDASVIALSKATESRLKVANLSLTAVTIKGLISLLARCSALEVLKLANISGLVSLSRLFFADSRLILGAERKSRHEIG